MDGPPGGGWSRRGRPDDEEREERPRYREPPKPRRREPSSPPRKPKPAPKPKPSSDRKARPLDLSSVSLGVVQVIWHVEKAIRIMGGETIGEHWVPRSVIYDGETPGCLDRDATTGDSGELWVPQWLADKIPW